METEAIDRVERMERCFDALGRAAQADMGLLWRDAALRGMLNDLMEYCESGMWLRDYELDEAGRLPAGLRRGVLSQDAVHNFLERLRRFARENGCDMPMGGR